MMPLGESWYRVKVAQIQAAMEAQPFEGLLLLSMPNVIYASGFLHTPSERPIGLYIPPHGEPTLFVPLLEQENAAATWVTDVRTYFEYPGEESPIAWMLRESGAKSLGVDALPASTYVALHGNITLTPLVNQMRWIKDEAELALIHQAAGYADYCLEQVRDRAPTIIAQGGTELDILRECVGAANQKMKAEVGELFKLRGRAVVGTVHSGARAALPHGAPIEKQPKSGEMLIAGIGASVGGYHAESGATFIIGQATNEQFHILQTAADTDAATVAALHPGATCLSVNEAALDVIHAADYGAYIRHRIGHGMGIEGHEAPWLAPGDSTPVQPSMVFSCEPGIYRPGVDGCRTINTLIVSADGDARVASQFLSENPPEQRVLPVL